MERRPTSPAGRRDAARSREGFALLEVICVVAIIALLAAILLPRIPRATSRPRLESYALEAASVLKSDRSAAIRRGAQVSTGVDAVSRIVRSGATGRIVRIPDDVVFDAVLPQRCNGRPAFSTISFFASGMSCGGAMALMRSGAGYRIHVNWLTGGVDIVPQGTF